MSARDVLDQIAQRADAATEGPWYWRNTSNVYLSGARSRVVMAFSRMGMQGAQPMFRDTENVLRDAGRENINGYPDAEFITSSRTDVPRMEKALRAVLDLHPREEVRDSEDGSLVAEMCGSCTDSYEDSYSWPCPTVAVIEQHLNDETNGDDDE